MIISRWLASGRPRWWFLGAAVLALRLPLWSLPHLGRDEALYLYWSRHPEPAYAPLLQMLLRAASLLGVDHPLVWRLPTVSAGVVVLWLLDRLLHERGLGADLRFVAVAAVAVSPWQTHVGSVIHPDPLMVAGLLGLALAARRGRTWTMALCAALAFWAKPSGLLAVAVAAGALALAARRGDHRRGDRRRDALGALLLLTLLAVIPLVHWNGSMVEAVRQFGRVADSASWSVRAGRALIGLLFVGGPLLLVALVRGLHRALRQGPPDVGGLVGGAYLLAFGGAALVLGQIKANWMLPAALLLWPPGLEPRRGLVRTGLAAALVLSTLTTLAFTLPGSVRSLERHWSLSVLSYRGFAGEREEKVAPAARWWHRLAVYQGLGALPDQVLAHLPEGARLTRIVSDDYGLAAQLAAEVQRRRPRWSPRLVLPLDPLFHRAEPAEADRSGATLVLAVQGDLERLAPEVSARFQWSHPVTGRHLTAGLLRPEVSSPLNPEEGRP